MLHVLSDFLFSRLHEQDERFKPSLSAFDFQHFLYNLTDLQISNAGGRNCECATDGVRVHTCNHAWSSPVFRCEFAWLSQLGISDTCMSQKVNMIIVLHCSHHKTDIICRYLLATTSSLRIFSVFFTPFPSEVRSWDLQVSMLTNNAN